MDSDVKTRFLIVSDTHGEAFDQETAPEGPVDVAIHCGDLTQESKIEEFRRSIQLLKNLEAGLKLVIAGNHDFTLDIPIFKSKIAESGLHSDMDKVIKAYGDFGEARKLLEETTEAGIRFLDEGTHYFSLANGASLAVYASPWVPSTSDWGFSYHPEQGHKFSIDTGVDIAITHGPPKGILDYTVSRQRAGCPELFGAIARARPRLHCFGHIHEGWGARLAQWRDEPSEVPSHFTDIDHGSSVTIEKLSTLKDREEKPLLGNCRFTSHCRGNENPIEPGKQTLFVNAAIQGMEGQQHPWLIDIELPRAP